MRKVRGFRLSDTTMQQIARMQRVLGAPNKHEIIEKAIAEAYHRLKQTDRYGEALKALEAADAVMEKLEEDETDELG